MKLSSLCQDGLSVQRHLEVLTLVSWLVVTAFCGGKAQTYDPPDHGEPGDTMIQEYLALQARTIDDAFSSDIASRDQWLATRERYKQEYLYMLGLWPLPERTPLQATVTGTLKGDGFEVQMLHYQSRPRLYVTGNLYRPAKLNEGERLPAVLYVCGHSSRGRNGNKTAFQSHGIWFARHGYVCLVIDTLQLGEIGATHHGTYREGRWWWHARGYTPAGVECWNGVRGIDYLVSRPDVDPDRIAVTGISGGGAATFWIAAADERAGVAVPVSGMADLVSYVPNRVINGHCDCMFLYNTFRWPWTRIAALIAPRPLLFVNSDQDTIFPMDANERVINRLERLYSLYGATDRVDAVVSIGGHAYRKDIRQGVYRFINTYLQQNPRAVDDSEVDLVSDGGQERTHPIAPERLRVFPTDNDLPADQLNTTIDQHFVPIADVELPNGNTWDSWRQAVLAELRRVSFPILPDPVPPGKMVQQPSADLTVLESEPGIQVYLRHRTGPVAAKRVVLVVTGAAEDQEALPWLDGVLHPDDAVYFCDPRGVGATRWTRRNPPNYVERSCALIGWTVDSGRVWDIAAAVAYLRQQHGQQLPIVLAGQGGAGVLAAYAAALAPPTDGVVLYQPPATHMSSQAPQFLNVLRVCDVPHLLGALAPRQLTIHAGDTDALGAVSQIYRAAGAEGNVVVMPVTAAEGNGR